MSRASLLRRLGFRLRHGGASWFWNALRDHLLPIRPACWKQVRATILGRHGLEIGGPSRIFRPRGGLPVYDWAGSIDNVNFSAETAWEHRLRDGGAYCFHRQRRPGRQWIREAASLNGIADEAYEFVLSSHCLEHTANPLGALREWWRIARGGAPLILVVPDPEFSFDHRRPITTPAHLLEDFRLGTPESDQSHLAEIMELHDLALDPDAGNPDEFRARSMANADHRCLHHHVFDSNLLAGALGETGWAVVAVEKVRPVHLLALARRAVR